MKYFINSPYTAETLKNEFRDLCKKLHPDTGGDAEDFKMMMNEIDYEIDWLSSKLKSIDVQKILYRMVFPENYKQISYLE